MRPPQGPAARAAPPPAPQSRRSGAPRPTGRGNTSRAERGWGPGARATWSCQERSGAGGREGWARGERERMRGAPCAAQSFVELAIAADLPRFSQRGPRERWSWGLYA